MRDLLMASSQYPRTVEFVLEFFQLVKDDEKKLNDLMTGFLEEMEEVPSAGPGSEKAKALENSSDDAPDTGLDFKEVQRRMTSLKRQHNKTNKIMEKKGRILKRLKKSLKSLATFLNFLNLARACLMIFVLLRVLIWKPIDSMNALFRCYVLRMHACRVKISSKLSKIISLS